MKKKFFYNNQETNYSISSDGKVFNDKTGRELKGTVARNEYHSVQLTIEGKPKTFMVHRLVAECFCENPNRYTIVDHIDRNKLNNNYTNLRWTTHSENALNVEKDGKRKRVGEIFSKENLESCEWRNVGESSQHLINKNGEIINIKTSRYLLGSLRNGYKRVRINNNYYSVHRLTWEAFNGKIPDNMVIDHINGNRADNRLENLRLVSQSENVENAQKNGHKGQVPIKQYDKQGNFLKEYSSIQLAADEIGVTPAAIRSAADRLGSCGGYFWIRNDQDFTIEEILEKNKVRADAIGVSQYSEEGAFINHFNSLGEAGKAMNSVGSTIKRAADAKRPGLGYYWILDNQNIKIEEILKP